MCRSVLCIYDGKVRACHRRRLLLMLSPTLVRITSTYIICIYVWVWECVWVRERVVTCSAKFLLYLLFAGTPAAARKLLLCFIVPRASIIYWERECVVGEKSSSRASRNLRCLFFPRIYSFIYTRSIFFFQT